MNTPEELNWLVQHHHDIEGLLEALRQQSLVPQGGANDVAGLRQKLQNVNDLLNLIMAQRQAVNYLEGFTATQMDLYLYKSMDATIRAARAWASYYNRKVRIQLTGKSHACVRGPNYFNMVPWTLLQNAVKYCASGSIINCEVNDGETRIAGSVTSLGPYVHDDEVEKIFESGYRGREARTMDKGSGLGLYNARRAMREEFFGDILFERSSPPMDLSGRKFGYCRFTIVLNRQ